MNPSSQIPWKRIATEGAAIVVSILLAFSIQAWWEDRNERRAERWLLGRLQADFNGIKNDLAVVRDDHELTQAATIALLERTAVDGPVTVTAELAEMIGLVFLVSRTFNPGSGSVDAFLSNEMSTQVENQPLADLLIRWSGLVEELQEEEAQMQKGVSERWTPFIASRVEVAPLVHIVDPLYSQLPSQVVGLPADMQIQADAEFRNHVVDRYKWQLLALRDLAPIEKTVDDVLLHLERELD